MTLKTTLSVGNYGDEENVICNIGYASEINAELNPKWTCGGDGVWSGEACVSSCEITVRNTEAEDNISYYRR